MAKKQNMKVETPRFPVPQSRAEAAREIATLGKLRNQIDRAKAKADTRISTIETALADELAPLVDEQKERVKNLHAYCAANRQELTDQGKTKTVAFETGEVKWRNLPGKVNLRSIKDIIPRLKEAGLGKFIRTTEEIDKDEILKTDESRAEASKIKGITITTGEVFAIKPNETAVEEVL